MVLPGIFVGYVLFAGKSGLGMSWFADAGKLEKLDASEIHARRLNAKEVLMQEGDEFIFPCAGGSAKLAGKDQAFRIST